MSIDKDAAGAVHGQVVTGRKAVALADRLAWSVAEFCGLYGCSRATVYRWDQEGIIHLSRSGGRTFITREGVDAWKARMEAGDTKAAA